MFTRPLVVKEWTVREKTGTDTEPPIRIVGRQSGLVPWILTKFGIDPTFYFTVSNSKLEFVSSSIFRGREHRLIPLHNVSSTYYRYKLPFFECIIAFCSSFVLMALFFSISSLFESLITRFIIVSIGALFCSALAVFVVKLVIRYHRILTIAVAEISGIVSGFSIKKSVIEGIDIDDKKAKIVCDLIESLMDAKRISGAILKTGFDTPKPTATPQKPTGTPDKRTNDMSSFNVANLGTNPKFLKNENNVIRFECGFCKQPIEIDASGGGMEIKCPNCGDKQKVPTS